jgi:hypothetical protein
MAVLSRPTGRPIGDNYRATQAYLAGKDEVYPAQDQPRDADKELKGLPRARLAERLCMRRDELNPYRDEDPPHQGDSIGPNQIFHGATINRLRKRLVN